MPDNVIIDILQTYQDYFGLYANFGLKCACTFLSILYAIFCVKEPPKDKAKKHSSDQNVSAFKKILSFVNEYIFKPFPDLVKTVFKVRAYGLHFLIQLQCFLFMCYAVCWSEHILRYFYMLKAFEGALYYVLNYSFLERQ